MLRLNQGRQTVTDEVGAKRTAYQVEASDVGKSQPQYLGMETYTFQPDDVGRLVEVIVGMSPGFVSWGFGSSFADLRDKYPETKPYAGAPSAQE